MTYDLLSEFVIMDQRKFQENMKTRTSVFFPPLIVSRAST